MKRRKYLYVIILLVLLTACSGRVESPSFECISNFDDFAYFPANWDREVEKVSLPEQWEEVVELPNEIKPSTKLDPVFALSNHDDLEIWIHQIFGTPTSIEDQSRYFVYKTETNEFISVSAKIENELIWVDELFVTSNGSVWGQNIWANSSDAENPIDFIPTISKYDEQKNLFELDINSPLIDISIDESNLTKTEIVLDENDVFWIFVSHQGLFRYDPQKLETKQVLELPNKIIGDAVLALDGSIIFVLRNYEVGLQQGELLQFFPESGELYDIAVPDDSWPFYLNLKMDSEGKLWIGAVGWMDINDNWELLYPEPDDYFENIGNSIAWVPPELLLESTGGYFWFRYANTNFHRGMAWYDPSSEKGCWFTTEVGNIIEDDNQNLWMVVNGKLYKYSLGE